MDPQIARKHNTKEYWDDIYLREAELPESRRADQSRWDLIIKEIPPLSNVLDYGSGPGEFLTYAKQAKKINAFAYDISDVALRLASIGGGINILESMYGCTNFFDVISLQHVLEHIENPEEFLREILTLLKPKGKLIIALPIDDLEWKEHFKVWNLSDMCSLLNKLNCVYKVIIHDRKTQEKSEEGIFFVWRDKDAVL